MLMYKFCNAVKELCGDSICGDAIELAALGAFLGAIVCAYFSLS